MSGGKKNDLYIEDLGYFKLSRFMEINHKEAFFLSRLRADINLYTREGDTYKEVKLIELSSKMKPGEHKSITVYLGRKEKIPVRLVIEKVPPKVANEKRRKLKTDKQNKRKNLSKERLQICDLNVYITNTTEEQIPASDIRPYYSLRWQIEIAFKAWKSVYRIDQIKPMKIQRFECLHYGTLILILLTNRLLAHSKRWLLKYHHKELSELKLFKVIKLLLTDLKHTLASPAFLPSFITLLEGIVLQTCIKERKQLKNTPFTILQLNP